MLHVEWTDTLTGYKDWQQWTCSQYGQDRMAAEAAADAETRQKEFCNWRETERIYIP